MKGAAALRPGTARGVLVPLVVVALLLPGCRALFETAAAVVNGRKIDQDRVQRQLEFILTDPRLAEQLPGGGVEQERELAREFLTFLVHQEVLAEYARERRIAVPSEEIDERLQSEFIGPEGEAAFRTRLGEAGATLGDVRHLIGQQVLRDRVVAAVAEELLSDERLMEEYESRLPELTTVELSHILVNDGDLASRLAGEATPENFARLARRYSKDPSSAPEGGDLGLRSAADLVDAVARAAVRAEVGAIVGPVESEFGFHLIWVRSREAPPFETQRPELIEELQGQVFAEWLLDRLRHAEIRVNPQYGVFDPESGEVVAHRAASPGEPIQLTP